MKRQTISIGMCVVLGLTVSPLLADGVVRDGVGARSGGRGGTNIAHSDNGVVIMDNPAGMVNIDDHGILELGAAGLLLDLDYFDPQNNDNAHNNPVGLPDFSFIRKSCDGQWAFGLGVYAPAGFGARWSMEGPPPFLTGERTYFSFGALLKVLPAVAFRLTDQLSIGATFGVAASHAEIEGPFFGQTPPLQGAAAQFDLQATGAAPTWSIGMQYQLNDRTALGLSYIDETRFRLDGSLRTNLVAPPLGRSNFDADVDLVWPRSLGVGVKHDLGECQRLSLDVLWFDWSHAFDAIDIKLTNPSSAVVRGLLGSRIRDSILLDWEDSISVRVGYEYFVSPCDTFRAGYTHNTNNLPSSTLTPYIPAILEHSFTVGYGKRWGNWTADAAYQFSFSPEREVENSAIVGGDFDNSEIKAQAHWLMLSVSYRF